MMLRKYGSFIFCLLLSAQLHALDKNKVLDFPLVGTDGGSKNLSDYRGQWLVLNYWASWCPPCREELPDLAEFHQQRSDVTVIGINQDRAVNAETLQELVEEFDIPYPVYFDLRGMKGKISQILPVRGLPTSYFISPEGRAVHEHLGPISYQGLVDTIEQLKQQDSRKTPTESLQKTAR